ncbi:TPA: DUF262 domain-containing protein [Streptococcus suis]
MAKIQTESVHEIFNKSIYRIPDYQRGYAWQTRQLKDFWDDLQNLNGYNKHFTGQLSIRRIEDASQVQHNDLWQFKKSTPIFDVLDGQQRLTTIVILIQVLVDFVKEKYETIDDEIWISREHSATVDDVISDYLYTQNKLQLKRTYFFDYYEDNPSYRFFHKEIYGEDTESNIQESFYTHNLFNAKKFFYNNLTSLYEREGENGIEVLFGKLTTSLQFIRYEIDSNFDVFVAFETMNNRGKPLSNLEILKNRLIYLTTLFSDDVLSSVGKQELRESINDSWKEIYQNLGKNKESVLSDNDFLRAHWIIYFTYSRKRGDDYIDYLLNKKFVTTNINQSPKVTLDGISDLAELSDDLIEVDEVVSESEIDSAGINNEKLTRDDIKNYVDNLKKASSMWFLSYNPWHPDNTYQFLLESEKIWLDRINRLGINYFRPLVTAALMLRFERKVNDITELLKEIERWIFISFHLSGQRSNTKSSQYNKLAKELYAQETNITKVIELLKSDIDELFIDSETVPGLRHYRLNNFIDLIEKKFKYELGYYSWRDRHYFLFEYEASIREEENEKKLDWQDFVKVEKDKVTIEHILPQTVTSDSTWQSAISALNSSQQFYLTHSLGNLLALSRSKNSKFSNDSFEDKKNGRYRESDDKLLYRGYSHGSHSEIEVSKNSQWTSEEIYARGKKMVDFLSDRWELNLTDEQKEKLLFKK